MKKIQSVAMMGMLMFGGLSFVSCSNDGNEIVDNGQEQQQAQEVQVTLESVLNDVNKCVSQVDFMQLAPLVEALDMNDAQRNESGDSAAADGQFLEKLRSLLHYLQPTTSETSWNSSYNQWTYANLDSTLTLAFDALLQLGNDNAQAGEFGLTQRIYTQSLNIVGKNGVVYTIQTRLVKDLTASGLVIENAGHGQLVVSVGNNSLFTIETHRELRQGLDSFQLVSEFETSGSLSIGGNVFTLGCIINEVNSLSRYISFVQNGSHVITLQMTVGNDFGWNALMNKKITFSGSFEIILMGNLAAIKGSTSDMGSFYRNGFSMVQVSRLGTSMENCQQMTEAFNEVTSAKFLVSGTNAAQLKVAAVQVDVERNLWKPVVVVTSPLIGKREMTIAEVIDAMDISFSDIMKSLLGNL